jgi:hypothetical protein
LPDNLPPFVTSRSISTSKFAKGNAYQVTSEVKGNHSPFNASKRGFQRRVFGLTHPVFVKDAAAFFEKNWKALNAHLSSATGSVSVPDFQGTESRAVKITPHSRLPILRLTKLARFKFCLVTDVSRCFPSIYTHSIPWALNGKDASKKDFKPNSATVFGNRLDYIMRQSQDGQTMGVPVGPDHSRVVAEIVLKTVDALFEKSTGIHDYIRHVDDYWIGANTFDACENALHNLRISLNEFSLDINEQKTRIVSTSSIVAEVWPYDLEAQLEAALDLDPPHHYEGRIVSLLGNIIEQSSKSSDDGIIKFFIRRLDNWRKWDSHWHLLEPFLAHVAIQFPHCLDYVAQIVAWRLRTGRELNKLLWTEITQVILATGAKSGRDSETLWALWLSKELGEGLGPGIFEAICHNNGPLVVAALPHMARHGLAQGHPPLRKLWESIEGRPLSGPTWPLTLELTHLGIKPPPSVDLDGPAALKAIFNERCSLFSWDRHPLAFLDADDEIELNPDSALGEFGPGYEDDDDPDPEDPELDVEVPF